MKTKAIFTLGKTRFASGTTLTQANAKFHMRPLSSLNIEASFPSLFIIHRFLLKGFRFSFLGIHFSFLLLCTCDISLFFAMPASERTLNISLFTFITFTPRSYSTVTCKIYTNLHVKRDHRAV